MPPKSKKKGTATLGTGRDNDNSQPQGSRAGSSNPSSISSSSQSRSSNLKWNPETIEKKLKQSEERYETRKQGVEALKSEGNKRYQAGDYVGALKIYNTILDIYKGHPVIYSNIAQTLLKLEKYKDAEKMATEALKRDPASTKARFRRALARKGLKRYIAALADISTVLAENPTLEDARQEQQKITRLIDEDTKREEPYVDNYVDQDGFFRDQDPDIPALDEPPKILEEDDVVSDSEDARHKGNGFPCKFYNHSTCTKGSQCKFSHAPDDKSQRDKLGRNVCNYYLLGPGVCPHEEKCNYLHDQTYLSEGWWDNNIVAVKGRSLLRDELVPNDIGPELARFMVGSITSDQHNAGAEPSFKGKRFNYSPMDPIRWSKTTSISTSTEVPTTATSPFVMVLAIDHSLDLTLHQPTLNALKLKVPIKIVSSSADASTFLSSPDLVAVVATDGAIAATANADLLTQMVGYVKTGGRLLLAGGFSSFVRPPRANALFNKFGLKWTFGNYHRTDFCLNLSSPLCDYNSTLDSVYSMKAVSLAGVNLEHAIYLPDDDDESHRSAQQPPVAYAPVAVGHIGYIGDVNWEVGSILVLVAMLGPLAPRPSPGRAAGASNQTMPPPTSPCSSYNHSSPGFILLLSLQPSDKFPLDFKPLHSTLAKRINFDQVTQMTAALSKLESPNLKGVFVTDGGIMSKPHSPVLAKLVQYVKAGGNVVFGASFGRVHHILASEFFQSTWKLEWEISACERLTGVLNVRHNLAKSHPDLPRAYTMKASQVSDSRVKDILYVSYNDLASMMDSSAYIFDDDDDSDDESTNSYPGDEIEAPVVTTKIENGHLTYIGDVNLKEGTVQLLLEIFAPVPKPTESAPPAKQSAEATSSQAVSAVKPPPYKPFMLVLSFGHEKEFASKHADVVEALEGAGLGRRYEVVHGLTVQRCIELMSSRSLLWVVVPYADIMKPENEYLVHKLVEFTKNGGVIIFGVEFASSAEPEQLGPFFRKWGLEWTVDERYLATTDFVVNPEHSLVEMYCPREMPQSNVMSVIELSGVEEEEAVYVRLSESQKPRITRSPILFTHVEEGNLGYIGEVYFTDEHLELLLLMLHAP